MVKPKLIIPCAGYGTRMGMLPTEAKEMLHLNGENKPVIDYSLSLAKKVNTTPVIISRKEKLHFNDYIRSKNAELLIIEPSGEWMDSVYESKDFWSDINILVLPDTRFSPNVKTIKTMIDHLQHFKTECSIAYHKIDKNEIDKWAVVDSCSIKEKPYTKRYYKKEYAYAMGLIGFTKSQGLHLFSQLKEYKLSYFQRNTQFVKLDKFVDITRSNT